MTDHFFPCFCYILVGLAINDLEIMVEPFLYPPLVLSVLSFSSYLSLQLCLLLRERIKLPFLLPSLPLLEFDVFLDLGYPTVQPFNLHILVVDGVLRPGQLTIGPSVGLILLADVLILFFCHFDLLVHLLHFILQVLLAIDGLIAGNLPLALHEVVDLMLHFLVLGVQLVILLLDLAVRLDLE